jgi:hypothetical protein
MGAGGGFAEGSKAYGHPFAIVGSWTVDPNVGLERRVRGCLRRERNAEPAPPGFRRDCR